MTEINVQGQIYLKSVLQLITQIKPFLLIEGDHMLHNDCLWCVNDTKKSKHIYDLIFKGEGQIYFKSVLRLVTQTLLSSFDGRCSYLAE